MSTINSVDDAFSSLGLTRDYQKQTTNDATELGLTTFLKLMVTQLNNQDPFKPMDNGQFLSQVAQFGTVSGLDDLNTAFDSLSAQLTSDQSLQAGALIGREVLAPIQTGYLTDGGSVEGRVNLESPAADVVVKVTDQAGQLVRELSLGSREAGEVTFKWDGLNDAGEYAAPGLYNLEVQAENSSGSIELETQLYAPVESVSINRSGGLTLNLTGQRTVVFEDISEIY